MMAFGQMYAMRVSVETLMRRIQREGDEMAKGTIAVRLAQFGAEPLPRARRII
jgi:hypothetical protein